MTTDKMISSRHSLIAIANNKNRLPSGLQAGQDVSQCLGIVRELVEHVVADNLVESLSPVRVVPTGPGVPHAVGYIRARVSLAGFVDHFFGNVTTWCKTVDHFLWVIAFNLVS